MSNQYKNTNSEFTEGQVYIFSIDSCIELIKHVQICTKHLTIAAMMDHVINTITQTMSTKHSYNSIGYMGAIVVMIVW
jgi:hypothetical protein